MVTAMGSAKIVLALVATTTFYLMLEMAVSADAMVLYPEGKECIVEHLEGEDFVTGNFVVLYSGHDWSEDIATINFWVEGPPGRLYEVMHRSEDSFQFYAAYKGDYRFCLETAHHTVASVEFNFHIGHASLEGEVLKDEHLVEVHKKVAEIERGLALVQNDQDYFRARELRRRKTNESTQKRVLWYALLELLVLVGASGAQVYVLHRLFEKRGRKAARAPWQ